MRYHKDIYMPEKYKKIEFACLVNYSRHAKQEAETDKYGKINLPTVFDSRNADLIEVTAEGDKPKIGLFKMPYDDTRDLCMVMEINKGKAITVFFNQKGDNHPTLNSSLYAKPPEVDNAKES